MKKGRENRKKNKELFCRREEWESNLEDLKR